ncbi:MAG: fatty acid desaturase [Myxococcota bacterium]|nr:fatty acid desaturase [Myxococcota bacterium]
MRDDALWRPHVGGLAWPTLLLLAVVIALTAVAWSGLVPLWAGGGMATLAAYLAFTVMHEASHGNVHGSRRELRWLGEACGWIASVTLFAPYPAFRVLHLRHHSHTNDPERDPDFFVAGSPAMAPLRCLTTIPRYYAEFLFGAASRSKAAKKERGALLVGLGLFVATAVGLSALGLWREVLALWIAPALAASAILAYFFDWLPHHPHRSRERWHDTRAIDVGLLDAPLLGQNLHLVHHLFPRVPFYRYRAVFEAARARIEAEGAPVVRLLGAARPVTEDS